MVQILKENRRPSFGQRLNEGVGRGLESGQQLMREHQQQKAQMQQSQALSEELGIDVSQYSPEIQQKIAENYFKQKFSPEKQMTPLQETQQRLAEERLKQTKSRQQLFNRLTGNESEENVSQEMPELSNEQQNFVSKMSEQNLHQLSAFAGQPGEEGIIGNIAKSELDRRNEDKKSRTAKEQQFFKLNEPKLMELSDNQRKLEMEETRYNRLDELFSDQSKFPSSFTAALFSRDGQINDLAYSQLTPEAQEALKLIIDSTSNIKDSYGARVTNFDLQTYLKKLPSLLNSPEGKSRVLRDLQVMNRLNQLHTSGIQQIFEEVGGSDKIPFSKAESLYKKRYGGLEKDLKDQFVNPDKATFKQMPDAGKFLGRKIKNPETGEIFISDGNEWKRFKG